MDIASVGVLLATRVYTHSKTGDGTDDRLLDSGELAPGSQEVLAVGFGDCSCQLLAPSVCLVNAVCWEHDQDVTREWDERSEG